ncbi:RNA 2'-phosphotransferase [Saccharothrix violaceirubra]|nr:RNA 2'-phosphotransferase [Saccharothrix violaceirubra]
MVRLSKRMSRHLRHAPQEIGLTPDPAGWVDLDAFVAALRVPRDHVLEVVERDNKQRYAVEDGRIRANQGHTIEVDLDLPATEPPAVLYHGTAERVVPEILDKGLRPMRRHAVHLSTAVDTARQVGGRHGRPAVLVVDAAAMQEAGHVFRVSANGVWLVDAVPPEFLSGL